MSAESTKEATAEGHKVTSVETPSVPKQEMLERIEGVAGPGADPPPPRIIDSGLVLVRAGSPNVLRFDHWQALQAGGAAPLTCHASHPGNGIGKMYPEERRFQEWRYTESKCVAARDACSVQLVQGKFLKRVDANLVLDVAFWKFHEGTAVNWVGGGSDDRTYLHGGGRDFRVNSDGSICLVNHPHLCLGVIDFEDDESGALGIISSVQPTKTVNKRHMTPEQRAAARRGAGFSFADHPALSAVAALVGALAAAYGCATMRRADEAPKENPCCGGKYKEAQA